MEMLVQQVNCSIVMSILDGFSGYNQVLVSSEDRHKMNFITPWRTHAYVRIPFRLMNVGATFQRVMDHAMLGNIMVDYQEDMIVYSKLRENHLSHIKVVFECCSLYNISLNPRKYLFSFLEGNLLGHIVRNYGIYIDLNIIKAIAELKPPTSQKYV
jgi:hypothetical protein